MNGILSEFAYSRRVLKRHPLRSLMSMIGVLFGVAAMVVALAVTDGGRQEILDEIAALGANNVIIRATDGDRPGAMAARSTYLTPDDISAMTGLSFVDGIAGVRKVAERALMQDDSLAVETIAVTGDIERTLGLSVVDGRMLSRVDIQEGHQYAVLGSRVAQALGVEGKLAGSVRVGESVYEIAGILAPRKTSKNKLPAISPRDYNNTIIIPLSARPTNKTLGTGSELSEIIVRVDGPMAAGAAAIDHAIKRNHPNVSTIQVIVPQALLDQANAARRTFDIMLIGIIGALLLVGGAGVTNVTAASVTERFHEIGVRRAIGARRRDIQVQFLCETVLLTISGGVVGIVVGLLVSIIMGWLGEWPIIISFGSLVFTVAALVLLSVMAGLYPAMVASRMSPTDALRYE